MGGRITAKGKLLRKYGTGEGAKYIPYIHAREFNSLGTCSTIKDWKHGRVIQCLSQSEANWYYQLRWNDNNVDIREQFPLDRAVTEIIAADHGILHPVNEGFNMTTDFLITRADGSFAAYSIKYENKLRKRCLQKLCIEKFYWNMQGVPFYFLLGVEVNKVLVENLRMIMKFYDKSSVFDKVSAVKHLLATKQIEFDVEHIKLTTDVLKELERSILCLE